MERAHYPFAHAMVEETEAQMNDEISQLQAQFAGVSTELNERKGYEEYLRGGAV
jgi:hypothetical protein